MQDDYVDMHDDYVEMQHTFKVTCKHNYFAFGHSLQLRLWWYTSDPTTCKINYVILQHNMITCDFNYIKMENNYGDMQLHSVNMRDDYVNMPLKLCYMSK